MQINTKSFFWCEGQIIDIGCQIAGRDKPGVRSMRLWRRFWLARRPFFVTGGSGGKFARLMGALHPLSRKRRQFISPHCKNWQILNREHYVSLVFMQGKVSSESRVVRNPRTKHTSTQQLKTWFGRHLSLYPSTYISSEGRSWYLPVGFRFNSV